MSCPRCNSDNLTVAYESYDDDVHYEEYECDDCGCVFTWTSKREIVEEPPEEDPLVKLRKKQKEIEEWYENEEEEEELEEDN